MVTQDARLEFWGAYTSRTIRPIWVAEELGLDYQFHPIGPRTGETQTDEYTRLNPKQKVPCMVDHNVQGGLTITESLPIARYLISSYGTDALSTPDTSADYAKEDEWCCYVLAEIDETSLYIIRRHRDLAHIYGESQVVVDSCFEYLERHLNVVEAHLSGREFVLDRGFSLADIMLTTCLTWADVYGATLQPVSADYAARMTRRDGFIRANKINNPSN
ncbi:MAG: glutathione S-transferase family protein [Pseudomonadota bacterium]